MLPARRCMAQRALYEMSDIRHYADATRLLILIRPPMLNASPRLFAMRGR